MSPQERDTLEVKADRAMRRGELSAALAFLQQLSAAFPEDLALAGKLKHLKENVQPIELTSAKNRFEPQGSRAGSTPLDEAEALAARGDYPAAIARYRRALAEKPNSDLLKERLAELFGLMQAQAPRPAPAVMPKSPELTLSELLDRIAIRRKG